VRRTVPRYFFHFVWPNDVFRDTTRVEFEGLVLAYWYQLDWYGKCVPIFPDAGNDWLIEIGDETGRKPLVVLPTSGPLFGCRAETA
jgi:hypothetical protein